MQRGRTSEQIKEKVVKFMKTTNISRQTAIPEELKPVIETKLAKYDKFFGDDAFATVKLSKPHGKERVELTITSAGTIFRGEETDATFRNALDLAMDSIERQIRKHKTKLEKRLHTGALSNLIQTEPEEKDERIIRTKTFSLKPMTPEEAVLQMELIGHDFFVFQNAANGETEVVYRRKDGDFGLIAPEK